MAKSSVTERIRWMTQVAVKSGDIRAEIQYGSSLCGFWGGSFCESWEQHHQPRGSSASLCAGVGAHFELYSDWSKFRSFPFAVSPALQGKIDALIHIQWELDNLSHCASVKMLHYLWKRIKFTTLKKHPIEDIPVLGSYTSIYAKIVNTCRDMQPGGNPLLVATLRIPI